MVADDPDKGCSCQSNFEKGGKRDTDAIPEVMLLRMLQGESMSIFALWLFVNSVKES